MPVRKATPPEATTASSRRLSDRVSTCTIQAFRACASTICVTLSLLSAADRASDCRSSESSLAIRSRPRRQDTLTSMQTRFAEPPTSLAKKSQAPWDPDDGDSWSIWLCLFARLGLYRSRHFIRGGKGWKLTVAALGGRTGRNQCTTTGVRRSRRQSTNGMRPIYYDETIAVTSCPSRYPSQRSIASTTPENPMSGTLMPTLQPHAPFCCPRESAGEEWTASSLEACSIRLSLLPNSDRSRAGL
jgi:hypothetical protein